MSTIAVTRAEQAARARRMRLVRARLGSVLVHAVLISGSFVMLVPFVWMVSTSLKLEGEVFSFPPQWIPNPIRWQNYVETWNSALFSWYLFNTIFVSTSVT